MTGSFPYDEGMSEKALVILADGFEEVEAITPIDLLRRAGVEVTTAALGEAREVTGKHGITVTADSRLADLDGNAFDMLVLPGGPGHQALRASPEVLDLVRGYDGAGKWLGAICAAPTVLHEAGVLARRRYTAHFTVANELTEIVEHEAVVQDGKVVTSRGAGTAVAFGLALVAALVGEEKAREVATSIHEPSTLAAV